MLDFKDLEECSLSKSLDKAFHIPNNFIDAGNGCVMPQKYRGISGQVRDFEIRADDVFMCSYPRTGSTWLQRRNLGHFPTTKPFLATMLILFLDNCT